MNRKSYIFSVAAVFALIFGVDFLAHQIVLVDLYNQTIQIWRLPAEMEIFYSIASQLLFAMVFVFIFTRNYENRGIPEGLRYGLYIGLLLASIDLGTFAYLPIPFSLTFGWMCASLIKCVVCGALTALIYRE